jgi:ABC-type nitrate/sulfonate/bicarbonate transport system substrate-binding protein
MRNATWCLVIRQAILMAAAVGVNAASAQSIRVGIPEPNNLQYMSFWTAQGAGFFKAEGLDIEVVIPDAPNMSGMILMQRWRGRPCRTSARPRRRTT